VLDLEKLKGHLAAWTAAEQTPWGRAKIAALYAELGEIERATDLANQSLREVRGRLGASRAELELLSLESWLIVLTELLAGNFWGRTRQIRDRLADLARDHCDPDAIREWFHNKVQAAEPPRKTRETEKVGFDPGIRRRSIRVGGGGIDPDDLVPAFGVLRLVETAPCVLSTQHMSFLGYEAAHAAVWLEPVAPFWTLGFIVRSHDDESIEQFIDRAAVALYDPPHVERIWQVLIRLARTTLNRVPSDPRAASNDPICKMGAVALDLLSRLAFRLNPAAQRELLNLLVQWLGHDAAARSWMFDSEMDSLITRLVFALPAAELPNAALALLASPLLGENGFGAREHSIWPDPVDALFQRTDWPETVSVVPATLVLRLTNALQSGDRTSTIRAAARLEFLHNRKWLNPSQEQAFEDALWSRAAPFKLPLHLGGTDPRHWFDWPGAAQHGVEKVARQLLISTPLLPILQPDGKSMHPDVLTDIAERFLQLRELTTPLFRRSPTLSLQVEEAETLVGHLEQWWPQNSAALIDLRRNEHWRFVIEADVPNQLCAAIAAMFGDALLLIFRDHGPLAQRIKELLGQIEAAEFSPARAVVGLLGAKLLSIDLAADKIEHLLFSDMPRDISNGGWMVLAWYRAHHCGILGDLPPARLVEILAQRVTLRAERGLDRACDWLTVIVREFGVAASTRTMVMRALATLLDVTDLKRWGQQFERGMAARAEANRLIELRTSAMGLASAFASTSAENEPVLERWKTIADTDPLPEVRRAWRYTE
jgi:hypothetical protein